MRALRGPRDAIERTRAWQLLLRRCAVAPLMLAVLAAASMVAHARNQGGRRAEPIDMVVLHSTGGPTCDATTGRPVWIGAGTLEANLRLIEAHRTLGVHYMIDRDGTLRASVPEEQLAHHVFRHSGRSIAIELINDGDGVDPFPLPQLVSLVQLLRDIVQRHGLPRTAIRRHSDLDLAMLPCDRTQRRKVDPGAAFPFEAVLERVFAPEVPSGR